MALIRRVKGKVLRQIVVVALFMSYKIVYNRRKRISGGMHIMKKLVGWLVINGSLKTSPFMEMIETYRKAAMNVGITLELVFNNELIIGVTGDQLFLRGNQINQYPHFALFLDKDIRLAVQLEQLGIRIFNSSKVIEICDDKAKTFQYLAGKRIHMPKTIIAPLMFYAVDEQEAYLLQVERLLGYPMVVKECFGSFGEQVYLVTNREELVMRQKELMTTPHLYQQYIAHSKGRDVRIYVVGGEIAATMLRTSELDFRANINNGGKGVAYEPPEAFHKMALKVSEILNADFLGIDLLFEDEETPILCEVNSNAHIKAIQTCTGVNIAEKIMHYIKMKL